MLANNDCTSPLFKNVIAGGAFGKPGMVTDLRLPSPETWMTTNQQNDRLSNKVADPYMQPSKSPEFSFDVKPSTEYSSGRVGSRGAVSTQRVPSTLESHQAFRVPDPRYDESSGGDPNFVVKNFERVYGGNAQRVEGTDDATLKNQSSRRYGVPISPESLDSVQAAALDGHRESLNHASHNPSVQPRARGLSLRTSRSKQLRWVGTGDDDKADAPEMAAARNDDNNSSEDGHLTRSNRESEAASTAFTSERNAGTAGHSWRHERDDPNGLGQQLPRSPSDESDRTSDRASDVYNPNPPVSVGDYEPSETSSTTLEEMDDGGAPSFRSFNRGSPQSESGIPRHAPRPSIRSNASTGNYHSARSSISDESYSLPQLELVSPETALRNGWLGGLRTQSWDERLEPAGTSAPAGGSGVVDRAMSVRYRPPSSEHGSREPLVRVASDPSAGCKSKRGFNVHDTSRRPMASNFRPNAQHQQWPAPPTPHSSLRAPSGHRWTSNSPRVPHYGEQSPMQFQQSGPPAYPLRPSNRLPPRPGHYPALPPRGTLQRVDCQHCDIQLIVPSKLPSSRTNIQKLRCGSCRGVSHYSVVFGDDAVELPFPNPDSHHSH